MKVSVIVPNYNHAQYLNQRINSILNQTYQNFELIILDDCSSDGSKEIIEKFRQHPKVSHIVYNEQNSGTTFKQWNKGVLLASGDLIWIAESDDYASEFFLEKLAKKFDGNPAIGIAYCNSFYVSDTYVGMDETREWKNKTFSTNRWSFDYINSGIEEINNYMIFRCHIDNVSCALIRKSLFLKVGMADESFRYAGDWLTYLSICKFSDIVYVSEPLNSFRQHASNASKKSVTDGSRPLERLLCYAAFFKHNSDLRQVKKKVDVEAAKEYIEFIYLTLKRNRNISSFLKGQKRLLNKNFLYAIRLIIKAFVSRLISKN